MEERGVGFVLSVLGATGGFVAGSAMWGLSIFLSLPERLQQREMQTYPLPGDRGSCVPEGQGVSRPLATWSDGHYSILRMSRGEPGEDGWPSAPEKNTCRLHEEFLRRQSPGLA